MFSKDDVINRVAAVYKGATFRAANDVSSVDAQYGAELIIDTDNKNIEIKYKKPKMPSLKATLMLPKNSGTWLVVSGNEDYSEAAAQSPRTTDKGVLTEEGILEWKEFESSKKNTIKIYKDQAVQIYVSNKQGVSKFNKNISSALVKAAGSKPVLIIAPDGTATIVSSKEYAKMSAPTVAPSAATATMAQSSAQSRAKIITSTTLPAHIDLRSLLLSQDEAAYERSNKRLVKDSGLNDANVKNLMDKTLNSTLIKTPYIVNKLKLLKMYDVLLKSKTATIKGLQAQYAEIYTSLSNMSDSIDAAIEAKIKALRRDLDKAFA